MLMNNLLNWTVILFVLTSCANIFSGNKERKLQTEVISKINEKIPDFSKCAKATDVFSALNKKRIRVVLHLDIKPTGLVEKFKLDNTNYPENFTNCFFNTVELIQFPKFDSHELLKIEQPFVFTKK